MPLLPSARTTRAAVSLRLLPRGWPRPMGRRSSSWGRGHDSGLANGRAESFLYLSEGRVPGVPGWNRRGTAL